MGESPTCLVRSFSKPAGTTSTEPEENLITGDPYCALTTSVSFRRFMLESLACEKWSCFSNNQDLEEAKKSSKAGLVAQRKAYLKPFTRAMVLRNLRHCLRSKMRRASANGLSVHSSTAPQEERRRSKPFEDHLILTVEDHVGPNMDEVLGKVIVPLSSVEQKEELKISEDALRNVASVGEQLNHEIANGKDLLSQKEIELSSRTQILATRNRVAKTVEDLKRENDEVKMVRDDQEKQILKLSEDNDHLSKENGYLNEANRELEFELHHLHEEHEKPKQRGKFVL
ncbi:FT-interacting protein 7 [Camellia lanceoleosa]|uniref:FT-interacting protein 7 n=1 Tax=Camellia lanceoleosa TaxID=1840588 RepID=A0ACC0FNX7_9ERIC|nr:FT-interacting protein 7 [Camellia lanceoleosa]